MTASDVALAALEGFESVEHLKRYTTLGMATDQGKTSNVQGLAIMAELTGRSIPETGTTIYRPPYVPIAIGALAGHHRDENFHTTRLTPSHHWAAERGAIFVDTGLWKRAQWYPIAGEKDWLESVTREVKAVRNGVGFCDVSTLGKIDVHGPDAGTFLDRVYINTFSNLAVGKARYGLMLREDGIVYDDGTTSRLAEDHYFLTTTTAKAGLVMQHLEFCRQVLFPELDVQLTSVSDQWAQFSIAGPRTRDLLTEIVDPSEDLSNEGFPFMGAREVALRGGLKARLFRISFSGEMAFEISVPARFGDALVRNLMIAGEQFGVTPYGTEALGVMRIEKGHVAGPELNGMTTAGDLGLGKMMSTKKDFIGRVMAGREALVAPDRMVVVGIRPVDKTRRLRSGAHVIRKGEAPTPQTDGGYVTSVCFSPVFDQWIGLGLVQNGRERIGEIAARARSAARRGLRGRALQPRFLRSGRRAPAWLNSAGRQQRRCRASMRRDVTAWRKAPSACRWPNSRISSWCRSWRGAASRTLSGRPARKATARQLPRTPQTVEADGALLIWSGPDQFLVLSPRGSATEKARSLFSGTASLSEQSDGRSLIRISGTRARDMLAKVCSLDLHPSVFPVGAAAATSIDHTSVNLWRGADSAGEAVFHLLVFATFAESLWHTLLDSGAEYGITIDAAGAWQP